MVKTNICKGNNDNWIILRSVNVKDGLTGKGRMKTYEVEMFVPTLNGKYSQLTWEMVAMDVETAIRGAAAASIQRSCEGDRDERNRADEALKNRGFTVKLEGSEAGLKATNNWALPKQDSTLDINALKNIKTVTGNFADEDHEDYLGDDVRTDLGLSSRAKKLETEIEEVGPKIKDLKAKKSKLEGEKTKKNTERTTLEAQRKAKDEELRRSREDSRNTNTPTPAQNNLIKAVEDLEKKIAKLDKEIKTLDERISFFSDSHAFEPSSREADGLLKRIRYSIRKPHFTVDDLENEKNEIKKRAKEILKQITAIKAKMDGLETRLLAEPNSDKRRGIEEEMRRVELAAALTEKEKELRELKGRERDLVSRIEKLGKDLLASV